MTGEHSGEKEDPRVIYADIIDLPHWDSPVHPRMSMQERAAQFAPYAALVGYGELVQEEARETGSWTDPGEDAEEEINRKLTAITDLLQKGIQPVCSVSFFIPDQRKAGGETVTVTEAVKRIDPVRRKIVLVKKEGPAGNFEELDLDRVVRIDGEALDEK